MREVAFKGMLSIELTFVCLEPGWRTMDWYTLSDAMDVGARLTVATIPLGERTTFLEAAESLNGDEALKSEPAVFKALAAMSAFTSTFGFERQNAKRVPNRTTY